MKIDISGIRIDCYSFDEVIELTVNHILSERKPRYIVTPNAHHIITLQNDAYFQSVYQDSFLSVPDGVPLLWAAKFLGTPLRGRVNGTDLFEHLCKVSAEKGIKVFLLGGRPGAADSAAKLLQERHPNLKIVGTYCPPYGFETDASELQTINSKIKSTAPDILFVGLGAPKQEKWIYENYQELEVPISVGIGVSFELVSNIVTRAPKIMQKLGLEWLFRLFMEPRRLWKRYIIGNTVFVWLILKQRLGLLNRTQPIQ
ncbi:MAG: WecB/TagA/CpsF family glycosyltransferase [Leptolyngbya sp. SIO1E4]|nr:WecB/TagA/CpsF family glycosyltransferase [Leptolyngbya sp. SIO1E4]